ncbi:MAG: T9SS type A sorting domain-containing protein [Bacteroidetes bacterium]|nr:T9SS type A sorting domain-containing protein [Bacteroidota bacterium]
MKRILALLFMLISVLGLRAQDCIDYVLHFQSNVMAGGPVGAYYNITAANLSVGGGSLSFDSNQTEQWDTLCMTAGCNLTITIDPAVMPSPNSFNFQIWALGSPIQFSNYTEENGVIQATFCCTAPCPNQIQAQPVDCNTYDFYVGAYSGNVLWNFGDTSNDPMGYFQEHSFSQNGFYNVLAFVNIAGCGSEYILTVPINVNCDTTIDCPSDLILEPLSCHDYFLHFDVPLYGMVDWQVDGVFINDNSPEIGVYLENGMHEIIAIYHPVGTEECMDNWPVTFWDTISVQCTDCQDIYMGFTSVLDLGGTEMLSYTISDAAGSIVNQGEFNFTANQSVFDFTACWVDGCYTLDICSEGLVADSNFFVDAVWPLTVISDEYYTTGVCNGRLIHLGLNSDCTPPSCDGEWMTLQVEAAYLTVPPFFSPDTLYWNVLNVNGIELGQGMVGLNDAVPQVADSVCISMPLSCYQITTWVPDDIWGMTYANVNVTLADSTIYGMINPNVPQWLGIWAVDDSQVCFVSTENEPEWTRALTPNPCQSTLNLPKGVQELRVYSMMGNLIFHDRVSQTQTLDVNALPSGIWIFKLQHENGAESTHRIVKL